MATLQVIWSQRSKAKLKAIYKFYIEEKRTSHGGRTIINEILKAGNSIIFSEQYQRDEIEPEYRRIIVRHYKLLYKEINGKIVILKIFGTLQNPKRQIKRGD